VQSGSIENPHFRQLRPEMGHPSSSVLFLIVMSRADYRELGRVRLQLANSLLSLCRCRRAPGPSTPERDSKSESRSCAQDDKTAGSGFAQKSRSLGMTIVLRNKKGGLVGRLLFSTPYFQNSNLEGVNRKVFGKYIWS
jgi:hypothetical protein